MLYKVNTARKQRQRKATHCCQCTLCQSTAWPYIVLSNVLHYLKLLCITRGFARLIKNDASDLQSEAIRVGDLKSPYYTTLTAIRRLFIFSGYKPLHSFCSGIYSNKSMAQAAVSHAKYGRSSYRVGCD